jgi:hypothetical protein
MTEPPPEDRRRRAATQLSHRRSDENQTIISDHWLEARKNFFSAECVRINAGRVALFFLKRGKSQYQQYRRCGCAFSPGPRWTSLLGSWSAAVASEFHVRRSLMTISDNGREPR